MNQIDRQHAHTMTLADCLQQVCGQLERADLVYGHGTDSAWDEAVQIVLFTLGLPIDSDDSILQRLVTAPEMAKITLLTDQRIETRKPLPYLTHCAWFMGEPFYVDERVLVPRSPIGEWIERGFSPWIESQRVQHILDIGTGSGCLAIGCAWVFPQAQVDAVDISADALAVAQRNVAHYELQDRVHLIQSDCFNDVPTKLYDVIISNPPYVDAEEMRDISPEYRHEPILALVAEDSGLAIVERILKTASTYLADHGILLIEMGAYNAGLLETRYPKASLTWLEQQHGGEGLLLITKQQLDEYVGK